MTHIQLVPKYESAGFVSFFQFFSLLFRADSRPQRLEQYLTSAQVFCHFFRQLNGRRQMGQVFSGK
jgi:hypothetical protein